MSRETVGLLELLERWKVNVTLIFLHRSLLLTAHGRLVGECEAIALARREKE